MAVSAAAPEDPYYTERLLLFLASFQDQEYREPSVEEIPKRQMAEARSQPHWAVALVEVMRPQPLLGPREAECRVLPF